MSSFPGCVCRGLPKHFAYCKASGKRYTGISTEAKMSGVLYRQRARRYVEESGKFSD